MSTILHRDTSDDALAAAPSSAASGTRLDGERSRAGLPPSSLGECLVRTATLFATLWMTTWLAPREIAIAAVVVAIASALGESAARAANAARGTLVDARDGADFAPLFTACVMAAVLIGGCYVARSTVADLLGAFEVERMFHFALPLAVCSAAAETLRRTPLAPLLGRGTLLAAIAGIGLLIGFGALGKTIGALLATAACVTAIEAMRALHGARVMPRSGAFAACARSLRGALAHLPLSLGIAVLRRLDVLVAVAVLGAEPAGHWCIARVLTLEIGRMPAGVFPRWRVGQGARDPRRAAEFAFLPWLVVLALLAPRVLPDLLGQRLVETARFLPMLAVAAVPGLLASAHARARLLGATLPSPSLLTSISACCGAVFGWQAMIATVATARFLLGAFRMVRGSRRDPRAVAVVFVPALVDIVVVAIAVAGVRDLLLALGRSSAEILLAAGSVAAVVHVLVVVGWTSYARRFGASQPSIAP